MELRHRIFLPVSLASRTAVMRELQHEFSIIQILNDNLKIRSGSFKMSPPDVGQPIESVENLIPEKMPLVHPFYCSLFPEHRTRSVCARSTWNIEVAFSERLTFPNQVIILHGKAGLGAGLAAAPALALARAARLGTAGRRAGLPRRARTTWFSLIRGRVSLSPLLTVLTAVGAGITVSSVSLPDSKSACASALVLIWNT